MSNRSVIREGNWACLEPKCSKINPMSKTICESCGRSKPRSRGKVARVIGKDAAEKSKGLFSAEDWSCTKCGNINWSRRTTCNICNAPKHGDVEARTGYGGGFMDREEIEYNQRQDSDEDYDEFGRKKKKQDDRNAQNVDKTVSSANKKKGVEVENKDDEEEEEDDDDGDISKYKLDDDDDFVSDKPNGSDLKHTVKRKRSKSNDRSRSSSVSSRSSRSGSCSSRSSSSASSASGSSRSSVTFSRSGSNQKRIKVDKSSSRRSRSRSKSGRRHSYSKSHSRSRSPVNKKSSGRRH